MRSALAILFLFLFATLGLPQQPKHRWALVIHGGAGVIERKSMDASTEAAYRRGLFLAMQAAAAVLERGGSSLDAVESGLRILEDDPLFNAGRGAVFTAEGRNELDAAVMDGATLKAGSVAGVTRTRHPVSLARYIMEHSPHVMLAGEGADSFGQQAGLEQAAPSFFFTERRWDALVEELQKQGRPTPSRPAGTPGPTKNGAVSSRDDTQIHKFGTVGLVAVDRNGSVAAGTSTGGTTAKQPGRVGDSPIIGAGTYASNESCAVSATGTGEYFIRLTVARDICSLVQYKAMTLQAAADEVIQHRLTRWHGDGGVIAITPDGQMSWSFNTSGMYRGRQTEGGTIQISIYKDEP